MDTVNQVKEALSAKSRTATIDELASQGRKKVRLIKAEHVAGMIASAVHKAIADSGCIPKEEADRLVELGRDEFRALMQQRQQELRRLNEIEELLSMRDAEIADLRAALEQTQAAPAHPQVTSPQAGPTGSAPAVDAAAAQEAPVADPAAPAQAASAAPADLTAALDKLAGSLNERLEKLGQKMGISSAVEGEEVSFDGLFDESSSSLESNMDNIQVKNKAGSGIAANLERLKKLKGG